MRALTGKIDEVFEFVQKYIKENGYAPSVREICRGCEIKSTATVFTYLNELADRGLINKANLKNRAVSLKQNVTTVPLVGIVAAG
ncbi:MAG: repressor LexA, partial [Clostridia bacterium]|nr:repressor LexA [Clostridia bacterium]